MSRIRKKPLANILSGRSVRSPAPRALAAVLAFGLTGCLVGPSYRQAEPDGPARWHRLDASASPTLADGARADLTRWWRSLNDPLLSELVEQVLNASPDLRLAQARVREARARRGVAAAGLYPGITASASASRSGSTTSVTGSAGNLFSAGFDASWELDLFGGVRRSIEAAQADQESIEANLDQTWVSLTAELARDYYDVRALQIRLQIARNNLDSQTETLQLTTWRAQTGVVSTQDAEQARSSREQTQAQIPALELGLAEAEHRLDVLLGKTPGSLHGRLAAGGELPAVPAAIAVGIPADTLRQRPDIRVAERKLAAETARIGVAEAARYPSFKLSGSIGVEAVTAGAMGDGAGAAYSVLGGITAPIFNAGRLRNQVVAQGAVREQAQITYEKTVLAALQEVEDALVGVVRTRERAEALTRAAGAARNAAQLARQRYSAGLIDFQPVLNTERTVLSLEDSLATTRADGVVALIRLYKAMGGGWTPRKDPS